MGFRQSLFENCNWITLITNHEFIFLSDLIKNSQPIITFTNKFKNIIVDHTYLKLQFHFVQYKKMFSKSMYHRRISIKIFS